MRVAHEAGAQNETRIPRTAPLKFLTANKEPVKIAFQKQTVATGLIFSQICEVAEVAIIHKII
jgi:hypothetical protein